MPVKISIHALLAESDGFNPFKTLIILTFLSTLSLRRATSFINRRGDNNINFYPRSPCGERHRCVLHSLSQPLAFLSTLSLRRATPGIFLYLTFHENFYPRSPCGERPPVETINVGSHDFYPRSPCGERLMHTLIFANPVLFLSTLSLRRATLHNAVHSLARNFYPRSPCGERQFSLGPVSSGDKKPIETALLPVVQRLALESLYSCQAVE